MWHAPNQVRTVIVQPHHIHMVKCVGTLTKERNSIISKIR